MFSFGTLHLWRKNTDFKPADETNLFSNPQWVTFASTSSGRRSSLRLRRFLVSSCLIYPTGPNRSIKRSIIKDFVSPFTAAPDCNNAAHPSPPPPSTLRLPDERAGTASGRLLDRFLPFWLAVRGISPFCRYKRLILRR